MESVQWIILHSSLFESLGEDTVGFKWTSGVEQITDFMYLAVGWQHLPQMVGVLGNAPILSDKYIVVPQELVAWRYVQVSAHKQSIQQIVIELQQYCTFLIIVALVLDQSLFGEQE